MRPIGRQVGFYALQGGEAATRRRNPKKGAAARVEPRSAAFQAARPAVASAVPGAFSSIQIGQGRPTLHSWPHVQHALGDKGGYIETTPSFRYVGHFPDR